MQSVKAGDAIRLYREGAGPPPFTVARVEPNRALVLAGGDTYSWAFVLEPVGERTTRLVVRVRSYAAPAWLAPVMGVEPLDFFMEQKMLRGIKERAERAASQ